jgi:FkbM family methyltransferase
MSIVRKIKALISKTGQRALGIDGIRYDLQVAMERLESIYAIESHLYDLKATSGQIETGIALPPDQLQYPTLHRALRRLQGHKIEIATLVDVGASNGFWSKAFAAHFPDRHHLLVDANKVHLSELTKVCKENRHWHFALTAVGGKTGELFFDASDPLGGHLSATPWTKEYQPMPVTTIDDLLKKQPLPGPFMIKLDTHGVEIPILTGSTETLKQTNVLVVEAYNFVFGEPAVPFWELCRHMSEIGFRPLDVFDLLYREVDNAFWQFDLLFVRSDLPLFKDPRFFVAGHRS